MGSGIALPGTESPEQVSRKSGLKGYNFMQVSEGVWGLLDV